MPFRTIDTDIWSNAFFDGLKVGQKLLFIYLFSNPLISNIGVLETTRARIAYETGTSVKIVNEFLGMLEEQGRIVTDGQYILNVKFIAKQTHFGGTSETNKNDRLLKNLLQLFNACPSEKLRRALQEAYPGLFCARQAPCEDETSPLPNSDKPLVSEQEAPSSCEVSPLSTESKPLAQEGEGSGGDIGDIGDIGEVDHTPLPPLQGGNDAAASDACEQREPHTDYSLPSNRQGRDRHAGTARTNRLCVPRTGKPGMPCTHGMKPDRQAFLPGTTRSVPVSCRTWASCWMLLAGR